MSPKVTIVILAHNGLGDTMDCIRSVRNVDYPNFNVIVVDNGSADGTAAAVREEYGDWDQLQVVSTGANLGTAGGHNRGIEVALANGAAFVQVLSNDTVVPPNLLRQLVGTIRAHPDVAAVGPKINYYFEPTRIWFAGAAVNRWLAVSRWAGAGKLEREVPASGCQSTDILMSGCASLIRRQALELVGLFDERYFFQNEDLEFCTRLRARGWKLLVDLDVTIWHKVSRTIAADSYDCWYYGARNRLLFIDENLSPAQRVTAKAYFAATRPLKFIRWAIQGRPDLIRATLHGWSDYRRGRFGPRVT